MGISICILVKDENDRLRNLLIETENLFEEVIVVDNSETKSAYEVVRPFKVTYKHEGDLEFDLARNSYVQVATQDWILVLDVDEQINRNEVPNLKRNLEALPSAVHGIRLPRYDYYGDGKWAESKLIRLFRNKQGIQYNNRRMHASVHHSICQLGGSIFDLHFPIHHFDILSGGHSVNKRKRNIAMLLKDFDEVDNKIDEARIHCFLGLEHCALNNQAEAELNFSKVTKLSEDVGVFASLFLAQYLFKLNEYDRVKHIIHQLDSITDANVHKNTILTLRANVLASEGNQKNVEIICKEALNLFKKSPSWNLNYAAILGKKGGQVNKQKINELVSKAERLNMHLFNEKIYTKGSQQNIFEQQSTFLYFTGNANEITEKNNISKQTKLN